MSKKSFTFPYILSIFVIFVLCLGYIPDDTSYDTNGRAQSIIRGHSVAFDGSLLKTFNVSHVAMLSIAVNVVGVSRCFYLLFMNPF